MATTLEIYNVDSTKRLPRHFLICDFCFWAASAIYARTRDIETCPQCNQAVSKIPLGDNEAFSFSFDTRRGVEVAFVSTR